MEKRPLNDASYEQFLNERRLMGSRCKTCGAMAFPPRAICVSCFESNTEWMELNGKGKLAAFTGIVVAPPMMAREGFGRNNPYIVGVVELDEGVKAVARITGVDAKRPDRIPIGMALRADFIAKGDGPEKRTSLVFKP